MNYEELTRPIIEHELNNVPKILAKYKDEYLAHSSDYLIEITNLIIQNPQNFSEEMTNDAIDIFYWTIKMCFCTEKNFMISDIVRRTTEFFTASPIKKTDHGANQFESLLKIIQLMIDTQKLFHDKQICISVLEVLYFVELKINYHESHNNTLTCQLTYIWQQISLLDLKDIDDLKTICIMLTLTRDKLTKLQIAHLVLPNVLIKTNVYTRFNQNGLAELMTSIYVSRYPNQLLLSKAVKEGYLQLFKENGIHYLKTCINMDALSLPQSIDSILNKLRDNISSCLRNFLTEIESVLNKEEQESPIESALKCVNECPICFDDLTESNACLLTCVPLSLSNKWATSPHMICASCWENLLTQHCPLCRNICDIVQ